MALTQDQYVMQKVKERGRSPKVTFIDEPEAEPLFCPVISVDDHVLEPEHLFEGRMPAKFEDQAPFIVRDDDNTPWWNVDGNLVPIIMSNGGSGRVMSEWALGAADYPEFRPGVWDSTARLHDMDLTGQWASLCFPSIVWGFAGTRFSKFRDPELGLAALRAYNEWMIDEWCGAAPDRYIPCQLPYMADPKIGASEIYRNAERGFKAVSMSENPEGLGFANIYSPTWEPFLRACEETETVVNLHVGSSGKVFVPSTSSAEEVTVALFPLSGIEALMEWTFALVPVNYPKITVALSEAGVSWVPMAIERLRRAYRQSNGTGKGWPADALPPMDLVQRNFMFTSIEDHAGFQMLSQIGEDRVMVEVDYPHFDSTWPNVQSMIRSELEDLPTAQVRKVCFENAARAYRHPLPPADLIARSEIGLREAAFEKV